MSPRHAGVLVLLAAGGLAGCGGAVGGSAAPAPLTVAGTEVATFPPGQAHTDLTIDYPQTPPVGGSHDPLWADCTGTVYDVVLRPENAVHSLEHGAVWVTYDPGRVDDDGVATLAALVEGRPGAFLSPFPGQPAPVSVQSWDHQFSTASVDDPGIAEFTDLLAFNPDTTPEPGATCESPAFLADPPTA